MFHHDRRGEAHGRGDRETREEEETPGEVIVVVEETSGGVCHNS
jgi:hypothetical protein